MENTTPLAELLRPTVLSDIHGQKHLLGPGMPLRLAFDSGRMHSMILWGPPGVGKTTIARLMASSFDAEFVALSAVLSGVKDIREAVEHAKKIKNESGRATLLFVDEVHRFNKSQQDAFLPFVESGLLTFVGATTENPSFEVNNALLSRASVYVLHTLDIDDLTALFNRAVSTFFPEFSFDADALQLLLSYADGDGRKLLNAIDLCVLSAQSSNSALITTAVMVGCLGSNLRKFDNAGDAFYEQISALHKSIRGSNPDASLYWLTRMLDGGADARYIARRLIRMAVEDIGLSDPRALRVALDAADMYERLGSPEGELGLAQAAVYLAVCSKSNAVYNAFNAVRSFISTDISREVPMHLRNAPTQLMRELGYKKLYRYPHDEPHAYAAGETYLPQGLDGFSWYKPTSRGLEDAITDKVSYLKGLDATARKATEE